eukprot:gene12140-13393_t
MKCSGRNWFNYTKQIAEEIGIELERVFELSKEQWKREVKNKVQESLEREAKEKKLEFKKMRHQREQKFERKRYVKEMGIKEASQTIRRRLEMIDLGNNFGKGRICSCVWREGNIRTFDGVRRRNGNKVAEGNR